MRPLKTFLMASSFLAGAAHAGADKPIMVPAPDWVTPVALPDSPEKPDEAPVRLLLSDQQARLDQDKQIVYSNIAMRIQTPQGLAAGNLSFPWNPETDEFFVHKLEIHRRSQTIDVLGSGQNFTVLRREPNLESAMLDGMLTANIQPEGLQVGDVLEFAISISRSDPALKGHVEQVGAMWNGVPISRARMKMQWPSGLPIAISQTGALPAVKIAKAGGTSSITLSLDNVEPIIPPKYAPARYWTGRLIELSDFRSWSDIGALMAPLYAKAAVVPAEGTLRTELEKIKAASTDPVKRAEMALALVQDRIRYVALLMGTGGYVPASAEETWSRRFGDCKAKTALLLALLKELGIAAEPVAVNINGGDGFDKRLPMLGLFNHVLVRATVDGKSYWLDGTRTGDTSLARLRVPDLDWGLPLVAENAQLVRMEAATLNEPDEELTIDIDARKGLTLPAPFKAETLLRGDGAIGTKLSLANLPADARNEALRRYWKGKFDFVEIGSTEAAFDPATGEQRLTMEGLATMDWEDGYYEADEIGLGYKADFSRTAGPDRDAPYTVPHPGFSRTVETIRLPPGFPEGRNLANAAVDETIAGIEYRRAAQLVDGVFRIEASSRTIAPEFPAKDAPDAEKKLRALAERRVYLKRPVTVGMTPAELDAMAASEPETDEARLKRGLALLSGRRYEAAFTDFDMLVKKEPRNALALMNRSVTEAWLGRIDAAAKDLDAAAAIDPKLTGIPMTRGFIAEQRGDTNAAIVAYGQAIALDPNDSFSLAHRATAYRAARNDEAALADAERVIQLVPQWAEMRLLKANIFRRQGKKDEMRKEAAALAQIRRGDSGPQIIAGRIYADLGDRDEAMRIFDMALAMDQNPLVYLNRAQSRVPTDIAGREADYDAALKLDPNSREAIGERAHLYIEQGEPQRAVALLSDGLAEANDDINLLAYRGIAYAKAGDVAKADQDFTKARAQASTSPLLNNLCWQKAINDVALEAALKECDAALAMNPDEFAFLDSKAFVLLRLGRLDEAIAVYTRVLEKNPDYPTSFFGRAIAWTRKGEAEKADADLAAARHLDPQVQETFARYGVTMPSN